MTEFEDRDRRTRSVDRSWLSLGGIVLALAIFNLASCWLYPDPSIEWIEGVIIGAWVLEPMVFGAWAALGPGKFVVRLPIVVPCLVLVMVVPGLPSAAFADVERYEFVSVAAAGIGIFVLATGLFLVPRWHVGLRFENVLAGRVTVACHLQYDLKYLLAVITLIAVALGAASRLRFGPARPNIFFGPDFYIQFIIIGSAALAVLVLPIIFVLLLLLRRSFSKRGFIAAMGFWLLIMVATSEIVLMIDGGSRPATMKSFLSVQLGAILMGACLTFPLRLAGYRLTTRSERL